MPYSLRGTSVVKSDSGEVVKKHPTREKALKHLKALKANVEEARLCECGAPARGLVCQRGHRLELREDWAKYDAARVGSRVVRKRVEGSRATVWSDEHGLPLLAAHPDDEVRGRFFLDGQQDGADYGMHESRGEAEAAGDHHARRILNALREGKKKITYGPVNGKLTPVNKDLKEAWSPEARAAALAAREHNRPAGSFPVGARVVHDAGGNTGVIAAKKPDAVHVAPDDPGSVDWDAIEHGSVGGKRTLLYGHDAPMSRFKPRPPQTLKLRGQ